MDAPAAARDHVAALASALKAFEEHLPRLASWGRDLATRLPDGSRLLAAGNGGSAAQAQHLTAELVGRYRDDRPAYSAIALHAETSTLTAVLNDYGSDEVFARSVRAHARAGDVLLGLSTSGRSQNVLAAVDAARDVGATTWALTGPAPNPLVAACDDAVAVDVPSTATIQELHLVAVHLICEAFDEGLDIGTPERREGVA